MSKNISSIDYERVRYINKLMDDLYAQLPNIYESLCDRNIEQTKLHVTKMITRLKSLHDSMEDDL